jgi:hypothetical protein
MDTFNQVEKVKEFLKEEWSDFIEAITKNGLDIKGCDEQCVSDCLEDEDLYKGEGFYHKSAKCFFKSCKCRPQLAIEEPKEEEKKEEEKKEEESPKEEEKKEEVPKEEVVEAPKEEVFAPVEQTPEVPAVAAAPAILVGVEIKSECDVACHKQCVRSNISDLHSFRFVSCITQKCKCDIKELLNSSVCDQHARDFCRLHAPNAETKKRCIQLVGCEHKGNQPLILVGKCII